METLEEVEQPNEPNLLFDQGGEEESTSKAIKSANIRMNMLLSTKITQDSANSWLMTLVISTCLPHN